MQLRNVTLRTLPVKRTSGQSAVAGAAYRAGERLVDDRLSKTIDYTARSGDVWHKEILAPTGAPDWAHDRAQLWNEAEAAERRKDGRPARDVTLGLPWWMSREEHEEAARTFAESEFVSKGHVVDLCFHKYGKRVTDVSDEGRATLKRWAEKNVPFMEADECEALHTPHVKIERDQQGDLLGYKVFQPHAHAYVTPRAITEEGFAPKRNRQFDRAEQTKDWRYDWPAHVNARLERGGYDFRVSATAIEGDDDLPLKPEDMPLQSYHIELEGQDSPVREDRDFNKVHNETVRDAARVRQAEAEGKIDAPAERFARLRGWWQSMRQSFSQWRDYLEERAPSWFKEAEPEALQHPSPSAGDEKPPDINPEGASHEPDAEPER